MKFEAFNFKKRFKICKIVLLCALIYMISLALPLLGTSISTPEWAPSLSDWMDIDSYNQKYKAQTTLAAMAPVFILSAIIMMAVLTVLFAKWEKDAKRYGFSIEGTKVHILCDGQAVCLDVKDIDRVEVLPKNCEPHMLKSKWTGVSYIVSGTQTYSLYYLGNMQEAKMRIEGIKAQQ